jgi:deoxyribonuclease V
VRIPKGIRWPKSTDRAIALQMSLRDQVVTHDDLPPINLVAGVDVGFETGGQVARAGVAVLSFPELTVVESVVAREPVRFPYVPGFLSFREVPVIIKALKKLRFIPDVILCDGQGYAHPRRFGIACHLGVLVDTPTVGVAKSRLVGTYEEVGIEKGATCELMHRSEEIGKVVRTRTGALPLFVSLGHRVSLDTAVALTLACTTRYRLPETTRAAHRLASDLHKRIPPA